MRENRVKRALQAGDRSLGTMVFEFPSTGIARIAAEAGAEFVIFDMEHTGWSIETIRGLIATSRAADLVPMVRVPATEYNLIARPLDVGAMGLMVPMVESAEQAQFIVESAKYPPIGKRGAAFGVAHDDYSGGDIIAKMASANDEVLLIAQIETGQGVENADAIAGVDGIDVLWIGHFDLTNSLGIPGQFSHPIYLEAVDRVLAACEAHGKTPGIMTGAVADGQAQLQQGFRAMAYSGICGSISWRCARGWTPCARRPTPEPGGYHPAGMAAENRSGGWVAHGDVGRSRKARQMKGHSGFDPSWMMTKAQYKMNRRRMLQGAAGAAALPLATRVAPARASVGPPLSNPKAVAAAQKVLQETGDSAEAAVAAAQQYSGVTLNYLSEDALMAEGPINFSGPRWQELTGITVNVVAKPFPEIFPTIVQEVIAGTGGLDVVDAVPAWMADLVTQGAIEALDPYIEQYMNPADLEDFHPVYRQFMNYGGNIYGLFDDGDTFLLYYRTDLFDDPAHQAAFAETHDYALAPPTTWEEYDEIQAFFTEQGGGEYWGGMSQRAPSQIYHWWMLEFRTRGGKFFDEESMDATLDTPPGIETLNRMLASNATMPPGVEEFDFTRVLQEWTAGHTAMVGGSWPPFGRFSEGYGKDTVQMEWLPPSVIVDNVGYAVMPEGWSMLASGFVLSVHSGSPNKEAAYLFAQWMNSPSVSLERVMLPYTLRDPFRLSHYDAEAYRALWPKAGEYLDMLREQTNTALFDIVMPGSQEYHTAIDQMWGAVQGGAPAEQAAADANAAFNAITDRIGRDAQREAYQAYLALGNVYPEES